VRYACLDDDPAALSASKAHDRLSRIAQDTTDRAQLEHLGAFLTARRANPPGVVWVRVVRPLPMSD
jgi:hypothetical protein